MPTKTFIGLGNPGPGYSDTRHNIGFMVVDRLAAMLELEINRHGFSGLWNVVRIGEDKVFLLKPQTYMNRSGESVRKFLNYYKIPHTDIVVIHDDLDLVLGRIKLVKKGGSGGHRGVKSIIEALGTENFPRMKIGIGRPRYNEDIEKFVLTSFYPDERNAVAKVIDVAADGLLMVVKKGLDRAMNVINSFRLPESDEGKERAK